MVKPETPFNRFKMRCYLNFHLKKLDMSRYINNFKMFCIYPIYRARIIQYNAVTTV